MRDVLDRAKDSLNQYDYAHAYGCDPMYPAALIRSLVTEVERLRAAISLHRITTTETPDDRWECCESCGADWPCPTAEAAGLSRT